MTTRRCLLTFVVLGAVVTGTAIAVTAAGRLFAQEKAPAAPSHKVIACYFHRTVRCPTCKKISAYIEESLKTGFVEQMKEGSVVLQMIDFQDPKNQKYTDYYKIAGPTLVIMDVQDGKVKAWKPAPKVWSLVSKKDDFLKYVQGEVRGCLDQK